MDPQFPLTIDQARQINRDLAEMEVRAGEMVNLMAAGCGESDQTTIRAQELVASVQRLKWALERRANGNVASASG